jgi:hypothetical protein
MPLGKGIVAGVSVPDILYNALGVEGKVGAIHFFNETEDQIQACGNLFKN